MFTAQPGEIRLKFSSERQAWKADVMLHDRTMVTRIFQVEADAAGGKDAVERVARRWAEERKGHGLLL
jgi:hypothetical protein